MPKVRIERTPVQVAYLGLLGFDHLMITFQLLEADDDGPQNVWYVMEGVRESGTEQYILGVDGASGSLTLAEAYVAYGEELEAIIGTPADRGSRVLLTGVPAYDAWQTMAAHASSIDRQQLPYLGLGALTTPTVNSTSVVASLLWSAGMDIHWVMPDGVRISPGAATLIGTDGTDRMTIVSFFDTLVGGDGRDILEGSDGSDRTDRLYGGMDDDKLDWSSGFNIMHGGLTGQDLLMDGIDTLDYVGAGDIVITKFAPVESHYLPDMISSHGEGLDFLFSIERFEWSAETDHIITRGNLHITRDDIYYDLGGDGGGPGDSMSFEGEEDSLLINGGADGLAFAQSENSVNAETGLWVQSVEWLVGSADDDRIYTPGGLRGVEGGEGDDLLDGRSAVAFSGESPLGYDVELYGGAGNDTLVSSAGRTMVSGGQGADMFVLSAFSDLSGGAGVAELVITDADASDRVTVPADLFEVNRGGFEGSELFPLLGAMGYPGQAGFANLPESLGLFSDSTESRSDFFQFEWRTQSQAWTFDNMQEGVIEFAGGILYNREGRDLIIHVFLGGINEVTEIGHDERPWTHTEVYFDQTTETIVRVVDFEEGDLGIYFYDPGEPSERDIMTAHGNFAVFDYPNWDSAVLAMTNGGAMYAALDERPDAPVLPDSVSSTRETARTHAATAAGTSANEAIAGTDGDDTLDGGAGVDTLTGGRGNDLYIVDQAGDSIVEEARAGDDTVRASVSYVLPVNVEHLELLEGARNGTGNAADNGLTGNDEDNVLVGLGGIDALFGLGGDDTLEGGDGNDIYYYRPGDGNDVIRDDGAGTDEDILFLDGIAPGDIRFLRPSADPDDLVLVFESGGRVLVEGFFGPAAAGFETIMMGAAAIDRVAIEEAVDGLPLTANEAPIAHDDVNLGMRGGSVLIPFAMLLGNDSDYEGDTLAITAVNETIDGVTVALEAGGVRVTTALDYRGSADFAYTVADGHGGADKAAVEIQVLPNHAPVLAGSLSDVRAGGGERLTFSLPDGLFTDPDSDRIGLSATLVSGAALPSWLAFDPATGIFTGTPPRALSAHLEIRVTATDGAASVSTTFTLTVVSGHEPTAYNHITGDGWANALYGTAGADRIEGMGGSDLMAGLGGDDLLVVAGTMPGFDVFIGGAGYDTILGSSRSDTIRLARSSVNLDGVEAIDGKGGYDVLSATNGNDRLDLRTIDVRSIELIDLDSGNDRFSGSAGRDVVKGGAGSDLFVFGAGSGRDVILDFTTASEAAVHDRLDLRSFGFDTFADLMLHARAVGHDTVLALSPMTTIRLVGVSLAELGAGDVIL